MSILLPVTNNNCLSWLESSLRLCRFSGIMVTSVTLLKAIYADSHGHVKHSLSARGRVQNAAVRSTLLYGSETWLLSAEDVRVFSVFGHRCIWNTIRDWCEHRINNAGVRWMVFKAYGLSAIDELITLHRLRAPRALYASRPNSKDCFRTTSRRVETSRGGQTMTFQRSMEHSTRPSVKNPHMPSQPRTTSSGLEDEHERLNAELHQKVSNLRSLSIRIGDELRDQNFLLGGMAGTFDRSEGLLRSTMNRVLGLGRHGSTLGLYCYLLCFATLFFFVSAALSWRSGFCAAMILRSIVAGTHFLKVQPCQVGPSGVAGRRTAGPHTAIDRDSRRIIHYGRNTFKIRESGAAQKATVRSCIRSETVMPCSPRPRARTALCSRTGQTFSHWLQARPPPKKTLTTAVSQPRPLKK
ncbi:hypothetical protein T265_04257 [Opisthorchis viverrini]|uniref:t-SNARE coiled-coil homology domain-containing protein n=1 Tax=Opisthorchis viverrini TaxID=6198 RepID=A0A074ZPP2_OPIVI|nr:hypothetical protein T265_04257 [Opisthorchis viverrini]KER29071.1 hypothetical protein T265_04257 [Opisthorchis viverrini]